MTMWSKLADWLSRPRNLMGARAFRTLAGATILYQYLINYAQRRTLYGPESVYPFDLFLDRGLPSLYSLSDSPWYFELVFHVGVAVTLAWTVGALGRLGTALSYVFWMSMRNRFPELWDGGDNLMEILFFYSLFLHLKPRKHQDGSERPATRTSALVHNAAVLCFALQVCVVYVVAGVSKIHGQTWWNGTALYYAMSDAEFYFPGVSNTLSSNAIFVALLTYSAVAFQVSFPFLLCISRWTRLAAISIGITFHASIVVVLGLTSFGFFMIAAELSLVTDEEYLALGTLARRLRGAATLTRASALALPLRRRGASK